MEDAAKLGLVLEYVTALRRQAGIRSETLHRDSYGHLRALLAWAPSAPAKSSSVDNLIWQGIIKESIANHQATAAVCNRTCGNAQRPAVS